MDEKMENNSFNSPPKANQLRAENTSKSTTIFLEIDLVLENSMNGILPCKLGKGDLVLAKIVDKRDIAQYLSHLLGGNKQGEIIPLTMPVEQVEIKGEETIVYTRFSAGVIGISRFSLQNRVKLIKKNKEGWIEKILNIFSKNKYGF